MSYQATMNAELDKMRANGLSIDGDNAYKRDLLDAVTGALAYGKQRSAPPPAGHWLEPFYEMGKAEADERDAARSLPVGVPDGLIDELRNHAAARTGYTTDLIGRAAGAIEKILEPTAGRWAIYKEKYCGCKDASRLNRCRGLDNCELPCRHPDRNTASPAAPTVKESLSVAPTVKAEHWKCEQCGASSGEACNANGCFANERSADASPSLPAAGSAEWIKHGPSKACPFSSPYTSKVDVRLRDGTERLGDLACNTMWFWYEHDPKPYDVVAYRIAALSAQHPDDAAVDRFATAMKAKLARCREKGRHGWQTASAAHLSSLLYHHMYKADPLDVANLAMMLHQNGQAIELPHEARKGGPQQSAPERVSVLSEALEDARRAMFAVLNQEPRLKSVAKRVLNAEIDRIDRALLAGAIDKS